MRTLLRIGLVAVALSAASAATASAAPSSDVTGSIDLAAAPTSRSSSGLAYGDDVSFTTSVAGRTAKQATVYVTVVCRQDGWIVYQNAGAQDTTFPLVDLTGQGLEWDGANAACVGSLIYRVDKGRSAEITTLDTVDFDVSGSA